MSWPPSESLHCELNSEGRGRSGGLALIWHTDVNLHITNHNKMLIEFYIDDFINNHKWYATGLYGYPTQCNKHLTCETINTLYNSYHNEKWLVFGDFNLYLNSSEKLGGKAVDYKHCDLFQTTLNQCDLEDLGYHGNKFTWANNQEQHHHIKEIIDRYCANSLWVNNFLRYTNYHLLRFTSDHSPYQPKQKKLVKFEEMWSHDKDSFNIVQSCWDNTKGDTVHKNHEVLMQLHKWGSHKFGDIPARIK